MLTPQDEPLGLEPEPALAPAGHDDVCGLGEPGLGQRLARAGDVGVHLAGLHVRAVRQVFELQPALLVLGQRLISLALEGERPQHGPGAAVAEVDEAVLTGLEPDREERWPDVLSFVAALASAPGVTEPSVLQRPHPPARRRRGAGLPATLLIALCLAVALATFGASYAVVELLQ